jgi:uncharacterized protein YdaT
MPWTNRSYPAAMKNLPKAVREKAVEIANALLDETRMDEGIAIATAISRAKDWAANRGKEIGNLAGSRSTDVKEHGADQYVVPYKEDSWAVKKEGSKRVQKVFKKKQEAVKVARKKARSSNASLTVQSKKGKVERRVSYNPNKRARKSS